MVSGWVDILPVPMVTGAQAGCVQREKEKGSVRDQVKVRPTTQTGQTDTPTRRQADRNMHTG